MAVVLMIVRNALGVQQVPPNMVLYGIAGALTIFVMAPVFNETQKIVVGMDESEMQSKGTAHIIKNASVPLKEFMEKNTSPSVLAGIRETSNKLWGDELKNSPIDKNLLILIPMMGP